VATAACPRGLAEWAAERVMSYDVDRFYRSALEGFTRIRSLHYALLISNYIYYEDRKAELEVKLPSQVKRGHRGYCHDPHPVLRECFGKYGSDLYVSLLRTSGGLLYLRSTVGKLKRPGKTLVVSPYYVYDLYKHLSEVGLDYHALYRLAGVVRAQCGEGCSGEAAALELVGSVLKLSWNWIKASGELFSAAQLPEEDYALIERAASYATWMLREARDSVAGGDRERAIRIVGSPMEPLKELDPGAKIYDYNASLTWFITYLNRKGANEENQDPLKQLRMAAAGMAATRAIAEVMKALIPPDGRLWR